MFKFLMFSSLKYDCRCFLEVLYVILFTELFAFVYSIMVLLWALLFSAEFVMNSTSVAMSLAASISCCMVWRGILSMFVPVCSSLFLFFLFEFLDTVVFLLAMLSGWVA